MNMITGPNGGYTAEQAREAILTKYQTIEPTDLAMGVDILMKAVERIQALNSRVGEFFLNNLLTIINAKKEIEIDPKPEQVEQSSDSLEDEVLEEIKQDVENQNPVDYLPDDNLLENSETPKEKEKDPASQASSSKAFLPDFSNVASKESSNVRLFNKLSSVGTFNPTRRMNQFVLTIGTPDLPRRHPGVDDSYHPAQDIGFKWLDLLQRGQNTLKYIHHKNNKVNPCPTLLFLRPGIREDEDALTKQIMKNHTMDVVANQIKKECQKPIEFHFAGHGSSDAIGPTEAVANVGENIRISPEDFAEMFEHIAESCQLADTLKTKQSGVVFVFHTCNSAYFEVDEDAEIEDQVLNETAIGRFYTAKVALGYTNFTVVGYRGFYQGMNSGAGIRVSDSALEQDRTFEIDGKRAEFRIRHHYGNVSVDIPERATFKNQDQEVQQRAHI